MQNNATKLPKAALLIIILCISICVAINLYAAQLEYDFLITHSKMQPPKGTILLIHGAAPLNVDGRIPITLITRPNGNHVFGTGDSFDAAYLAQAIADWLDGTLKDAAKTR